MTIDGTVSYERHSEFSRDVWKIETSSNGENTHKCLGSWSWSTNGWFFGRGAGYLTDVDPPYTKADIDEINAAKPTGSPVVRLDATP